MQDSNYGPNGRHLTAALHCIITSMHRIQNSGSMSVSCLLDPHGQQITIKPPGGKQVGE